MKSMSCMFYICLLLLCVLTQGCREEAYSFKKEVIKQCNTVCDEAIKDRFTLKEMDDIAAATEIIKQYWRVSSKEKYELFTTNYRSMLEKIYMVPDANTYEKKMIDAEYELTWDEQIYQEVKVPKNDIIQIHVLSKWFRDGYEGFKTFIFIMKKHNGQWKIDDIIYN